MAGIVAGKVRKARERDAKEEGGQDKGRQMVGESSCHCVKILESFE